eukprot:6458447-Amphidinium_carterae.1
MAPLALTPITKAQSTSLLTYDVSLVSGCLATSIRKTRIKNVSNRNCSETTELPRRAKKI